MNRIERISKNSLPLTATPMHAAFSPSHFKGKVRESAAWQPFFSAWIASSDPPPFGKIGVVGDPFTSVSAVQFPFPSPFLLSIGEEEEWGLLREMYFHPLPTLKEGILRGRTTLLPLSGRRG